MMPLLHRVTLKGAEPNYFYIRHYPQVAGKDMFYQILTLTGQSMLLAISPIFNTGGFVPKFLSAFPLLIPNFAPVFDIKCCF